ncbi:MAG: phosphoadenosine phosphosulfate reductase family protein [Sedimentisphaerales bacterium]|nr:phosphoadenosine phosphosulfate reductase family protein [Sedimentisphaerales bacterium]
MMESKKTKDDMIDIEETNKYLNTLSAAERIKWAYKRAPDKLVATTSGGRTSRILPNLIKEALGFSIPTIFIDTGHYPPETYKFIAQMHDAGIDIRPYGAGMSPELMTAIYGELWKEHGGDYEMFLDIVKHRPLNQAFQELKPHYWLRGLMGFQTAERSKRPVLEYKNNLYQLHPMIDWSRQQVNDYLKENNLPVNESHFDITKGQNLKSECKIDDHCGFVDGGGI